MLSRKHYKTTIPRVIVIAGATTVICYAIIETVFLTHGNLRSLLPPWQLVVVEVGSVSFLVSLALGTSKRRADRFVFVAAIAISIAITVLVAFFWGLGHTWSMASAIGKAIGAFLTLAYPILLSTVAILMMRNRSVSSTTIWAASIALCLVLLIPTVFVGVTLACGLTGDCL